MLLPTHGESCGKIITIDIEYDEDEIAKQSDTIIQ